MRRPEREDIERLGEGEVMKSDVQTRFSGVWKLENKATTCIEC